MRGDQLRRFATKMMAIVFAKKAMEEKDVIGLLNLLRYLYESIYPRCEEGWFGYPDCQPCECSPEGSTSREGICDADSGQCPCQVNFGGRKCDKCTPGYYSYPSCFSKSQFIGSNSIDVSTPNSICSVRM